MEPLGINFSLLLPQLFLTLLLIAFPIVSLIDLGRRKLRGVPLAMWVFIICSIPLLGSLAYWIIKPSAENGVD
jgi:hypothetical protein